MADSAQYLARHPGERLPPALVQSDALARLRAEQEEIMREIEAKDRLEADSQKGQRLGPGRGGRP